MVAPENTGHFDPITSLADIHQLIIHTKGNRVRSLAIRNAVRCFLQLDDLLVGKYTAVMDELHRVSFLTHWTWALSGFRNLSTINVDLNTMVADLATEESWKDESITII